VIADHTGEVDGITTYRGLEHIARIQNQIKPDLTIDWGFIHHADIHRLGGGTHEGYMHYCLHAYRGLSLLVKRLRNNSPRQRAIVRKQKALLQHPGAFFLANSKFTADQAIMAGADKNAVSVLHNGVDTQQFSPSTDNQHPMKMKTRWGLGPDDVAVLFVAHNLRLKNFSLTARVFKRLANKFPHIKLIVIGKHRPTWLPPNSVHIGKQTDMAACYQAADCLVHPTFFDSCANVVLEAMSCGLPVMVSDVCGANELIRDGHSGFVVPVSGPIDITTRWEHQLHRLAEDARLRSKIGTNGRKRMLENDFDNYVSQFDQFMRRVLGINLSL